VDIGGIYESMAWLAQPPPSGLDYGVSGEMRETGRPAVVVARLVSYLADSFALRGLRHELS